VGGLSGRAIGQRAGSRRSGSRRLITELHRTACVLMTAASTDLRHSVPPKRSILPKVCGRRGEATTGGMPRFSQFEGECALPAPSDVLAAVVGPHLRQCAVAVQRRPEHLSMSQPICSIGPSGPQPAAGCPGDAVGHPHTYLILKDANSDWGCERISAMLVRGPALLASPEAVAAPCVRPALSWKRRRPGRIPDHARCFDRACPN
jgi:hypothetical protein